MAWRAMINMCFNLRLRSKMRYLWCEALRERGRQHFEQSLLGTVSASAKADPHSGLHKPQSLSSLPRPTFFSSDICRIPPPEKALSDQMKKTGVRAHGLGKQVREVHHKRSAYAGLQHLDMTGGGTSSLTESCLCPC